MKRKKMLAVITALVLATGSLSACGNLDLDSMSYDETVDYADDYGIEFTVEPTEDEVIVKDEVVVEETDIGDEDEAVVEDTDDGDEVAVEETETVKTETTETKTNGSTSGSNSTGGSTTENAQPATPAPATPTPTPQPTHTHNWKEHTVTEQVWVPNIVVVDDYEEQVVGHTDDVFICNCDFTTTNRDTIAEHVKNHAFAGENTQFTIQAGHNIVEQVKVGSHEEDHGHNETKTYVDYYYCDCGERK